MRNQKKIVTNTAISHNIFKMTAVRGQGCTLMFKICAIRSEYRKGINDYFPWGGILYQWSSKFYISKTKITTKLKRGMVWIAAVPNYLRG